MIFRQAWLVIRSHSVFVTHVSPSWHPNDPYLRVLMIPVGFGVPHLLEGGWTLILPVDPVSGMNKFISCPT